MRKPANPQSPQNPPAQSPQNRKTRKHSYRECALAGNFAGNDGAPSHGCRWHLIRQPDGAELRPTTPVAGSLNLFAVQGAIARLAVTPGDLVILASDFEVVGAEILWVGANAIGVKLRAELDDETQFVSVAKTALGQPGPVGRKERR